MNHYWATKKVAESIHSASEFEKEMWILRNAMVWPAGELNVSDISSRCSFSSLDKEKYDFTYIYVCVCVRVCLWKAKIKCRYTKQKKNKDKSHQILKQKFLTVWCHVRLPAASQVTFFIFTFNQKITVKSCESGIHNDLNRGQAKGSKCYKYIILRLAYDPGCNMFPHSIHE